MNKRDGMTMSERNNTRSDSHVESVRRKDGRKLPDDVHEKLRDATWAGLAQKMQEDLAILCKQHGHIWIEDTEKGIICQRCGKPKPP
jgi:hypothetical protein